MDSTQNVRIGGGQTGFHNFMYPAKTNPFTNMFTNRISPFQRTFASVVSCGSNTGLNLKQSSSKLMNSFFEAVINKEPSQSQPIVSSKREFNDYRKMPNWRCSMEDQNNQRYAKASCQGSNNSFYKNHRYRPPNKKFHYSQPQNQYNSQLHQQKPSHQMEFRHYDAKHRHEKDRSSIERDIRNDRCDITNRFVWRRKSNQKCQDQQPPSASTTTTKRNPPFEIYSLEEFPAIVATTLSSMCSPGSHSNMIKFKNDEIKKPRDDIDEHDFVKFQSDIARTTPSYIQPPIRFNLCEAVTKIVKSPKKLLALPLGSPKRSCLKATPLKARTMSECSDDFIVFDYTNNNNNIADSESDDEDDDEEIEDSEEEEDSDEECGMEENDSESECDKDDKLELDEFVQQPDSGVEIEKKVHFNLSPKVNVIRAWDYAYREARKGDVWLQLARDRGRFNKRIQDCERVLKSILNEDHRTRVFKERFDSSQEDRMRSMNN